MCIFGDVDLVVYVDSMDVFMYMFMCTLFSVCVVTAVASILASLTCRCAQTHAGVAYWFVLLAAQ